MRTTNAGRCWVLLAVAGCSCGGRGGGEWTPPPPTAVPLPAESDAGAPPPRPYATAEITSPDGQIVVGVSLTVLGAPPATPGGFEPSYPSLEGSQDVAGVLVSARLYPPLAWELAHGSFDGYEPGPDANEPEPSFTFAGQAAREPMELLVFGQDASWRETVPLAPCAAEPCPTYASPAASSVVVVAAGTAERLGLGAGWTIALAM